MTRLTKKTTPDRSKIDVADPQQVKYWTRSLGVSKADLIDAAATVGNAAAAVRKELQTKGLAKPHKEKPLEPDDFPVSADGTEIKTQDGTPIAVTSDPAVATDVADRLNSEEARREEDKWSA
jgi:hypothetical protein